MNTSYQSSLDPDDEPLDYDDEHYWELMKDMADPRYLDEVSQ